MIINKDNIVLLLEIIAQSDDWRKYSAALLEAARIVEDYEGEIDGTS